MKVYTCFCDGYHGSRYLLEHFSSLKAAWNAYRGRLRGSKSPSAFGSTMATMQLYHEEYDKLPFLVFEQHALTGRPIKVMQYLKTRKH